MRSRYGFGFHRNLKDYAGSATSDGKLHDSVGRLVAGRNEATDGIMKLPVTRGGTRVVLEVPVKTETVARAHQLRVANEALWGAFTARP